MPLMENLPMRIVDSATLKQCIFWIAYDQTPLFPDHEDLRTYAIERTYFHLRHNSQEIQRAKDHLITFLAEGRIEAKGYKGEPPIDENGSIAAPRVAIDPIHWRSHMSDKLWENSALNSTMTGVPIKFRNVVINTDALFTAFPHANMDEVLAGHENKAQYLGKKNKTKSVSSPVHKNSDFNTYIPEPSALVKTDYEEVVHWLKTFNTTKVQRAAKHAAKATTRSSDAIRKNHARYTKYLKQMAGQMDN